jgi:hypothetical protein
MAGIVYADDALKKDFDLLKEAEKIEEKEKGLKYDKDGNNKDSIKNEDQKRHEDIVKELNSRGIFHKSQTLGDSMVGYEVVNTQSISNSDQIQVITYSPTGNNIETDDYVCSPCGETHDKKLSIKSGMEWNNSYFPAWVNRVESDWSKFGDMYEAARSQISGNEHDVRIYVKTKSNHPITTASFTIHSDVFIRDQHGGWVTLGSTFIKAYPQVYYPYAFSIKGDVLYTKDYLPGPTRHIASITILAIS